MYNTFKPFYVFDKRVNLLFLIINLIFLNTPFLYAQDTHFSQFTQSPLTVNPAQAGLFDGDFRAIVNYRNQWSSVDGYRTEQLSCDGNMLKNKWTKGFLGLGLNVLSDKA